MISVVINTLNEESRLAGCLESVRWCDDIVVVDMRSEDATAEIARAHGCRVFEHERMGYVEPARNFAIAQARNAWVLVLDADERASAGLAKWIESELANCAAAAVAIPRRNFYGETWVTCCGWFPDTQVRLYRRDAVRYSERIHRAPEIQGETLALPLHGEAFIHHLAFESLASRVEKINKYGAITGGAMAAEGRTISAGSLLFRTFHAFFAAWVFQRGWRFGALGAILSLERATATFLKYATLWEINRNYEKPEEKIES